MTDTAGNGLADLLATPKGREFLLSNGIHSDPRAFRAVLAPPNDRRLAAACGAEHGLLVHLHQQVYVDHRPSVVAKVRALDCLTRSDAREQRLAAAYLWIDTDRAASDKLACRFYWPFRGAMRVMKITPPGSERMETRFTRVDPARTEVAFQRIAGYIGHDVDPAGASSSEQAVGAIVGAALPAGGW